MNARRTPQRIFRAHPPDQCAQICGDLWPASKGAGFPPPISPEAGPVPAHKGLRPDDRDGLEDRWKPSIQHDQEQAIPIRELDATTHPPLQHNQLMSQCRVLCLKSALRLERRDEQGQEEAEQRDRLGDSVTQSIRIRFSVHTTVHLIGRHQISGCVHYNDRSDACCAKELRRLFRQQIVHLNHGQPCADAWNGEAPASLSLRACPDLRAARASRRNVDPRHHEQRAEDCVEQDARAV
jgi:hypothetical protein